MTSFYARFMPYSGIILAQFGKKGKRGGLRQADGDVRFARRAFEGKRSSCAAETITVTAPC